MMSCAEIITMCLQSAKHQQQQQHLFAKEPRTPRRSCAPPLSIIEDIFRRADKNDDGKLNFEEFKACFDDGIISTAELEKLFCSIDKQETNNLDTSKLSKYFLQHLGAYLSVLSALEELNTAILKAMDQTKEEYHSSSVLGQFVTRFMLRETSSQLQSLQVSLQWAMAALERQSGPESRETEDLSEPQSTRRSGFQTLRQLCLSPIGLGTQKLCVGVHLQPENHCVSTFPSPQQAKMECQNVLLVQRQMLVMENNLSEFQKELEKYTIAASHHGDSLHVYVQKQTEERRVVVYEFWRDRASWTRGHVVERWFELLPYTQRPHICIPPPALPAVQCEQGFPTHYYKTSGGCRAGLYHTAASILVDCEK
ncbi:N-terminal EF-hand calcium-binding protein 1 isoform X1 [Scleropages formosus]|uniref:N-terminal EF-hand calcium-binding protein 1 isoform X1 n=1 Tax=Scleropages formosus TaxID=113540 RepID=UPI0010FACC3E|nr:N-terminal EF-hand calcium-binding protein 1-like isoform X1 [Scleropages formosus]XP_029103855.1 N-terminal EF-hand calcium-binding protein 1-like isoform X1 [Scleropages formosus]